MKPNIKKLLILNAPYLLFVYLFDKVGQAVRLSPGADLSGKLLSIGSGFSAAFSNALPSFIPMDLLIGIVGAVIIRLAVYLKGKNAKKYRKGMEYGSARWGNAEDIKPYIDPVFENNVLLTQTERLMMSSRPKHPKYARNKNVLVIGGSGSGKTRFFVKPNLMQMHSSYVVTDPKGTVLIECGKLLQRGGYKIKVLNTINFKKSMKIEEQKKAVRSGYDMDIIPSDLATFGSEAKNLLQDLQSRNERMFLLTFLVVNMADTKRKLDNDVFATAGFAQKNNCALTRLDYLQEAGFMSSIPLGENLIPIQRGLTTSSTAIFIPFITQELFQRGAALYYGLNALSNNMILCDRKQLKNPNGLILGTPGSGKSFAAKREMTNAFLITDDDIIICDPEAEYFSLVQRLGGQVIRLSPAGKGMDGKPQYVNPMDINLNYSEDDNPLALKSDFILSLCELVIGGKEGLQPVEKTVIDRAVRNVYRPFLAEPDPAKMPILGDLYNELLKQPEPEAARIAAALELYVSGSLNVFNHRTNVELSNRLVCFDIKQLGKQLKKLGMLIVQDQVWNRVTVNRAEKKATRYYMDEFHLLLKEEQTAAYSVEIWKRFRKWGGIPTAITQNVKDLLSSREVENIFENSDFVLMLNQAQGDRAILAKQLNISPQQMKYVTHTEAGEGLIFYGNVVLPFIDRFPTDTELYRLLTTKPEEVSKA